MKPILLELPHPILTPRLRLEPAHITDGKAINDALLSNIDSISEWMPWANPPPSVKESDEYARISATDFILRKELAFRIFDRHTGQMLGSSGFHHINWKVPCFDIGYWLRKEALGKGFVTETANALTRYAFEILKAKRVAIHCDKDNVRSRKVPETLGFDLEGTLRNHQLKVNGRETRDTLVYSRIDLKGLPDLDTQW